jgi:hypothetical protein
MKRSVMYWGLAVCSLVFMFSSCEREVSDVVPGELIKLRFSANETGYGADEELTRSAGNRVLESVDIARQGSWTISADLIEDDVSPTRAVSNGLVNGAKVLIVVYNNADTYLASDVYTYNSSAKDLSGGSITANVGSTYRFVACSYNSTTVAPTYAASINGISPQYDLLWGRTNPITVSSANIDFSVSHKFMKVRLTTAVSGGLGNNSNPVRAGIAVRCVLQE